MSKTILLTGATDGIGLITAEKLINLGHHVLIHGRNPEKLNTVKGKLAVSNSGSVESFQADLSNFSEVEKLATEITEKYQHLDVLINNAGVYKTDSPLTNNNLDVRFVVNTLAPYLLTKQLLPLMDNTGRVINLSSAAQESVDLDVMAGKRQLKEQFSAYGQSKLAITMWSKHLAYSLGDSGPAILTVNPGSLLASKMVKEGFGVEGKDINIGADILVRTGLSDEFSQASGEYFDNDIGELSQPHPDALDTGKCKGLVLAMEDLLESLEIHL